VQLLQPMDKTARTPSVRSKKESCQETYSHRTTGTCRTSDAWKLSQPAGPAEERSSVRTSDQDRTTDKYRTSDALQQPDDRAPPEIRCHPHRAKTTEIRSPPDDRTPDVRRPPEIRRYLTRAESPDIRRRPDVRSPASHRTTGNDRTSDVCLRTVTRAETHVPLRPLRLYILFFHLRFRVSIVIAHFGDRALLIHLYPYSIGVQGLLGEDPPSGFKTPIVGRSI
jgi:hypothetical protein